MCAGADRLGGLTDLHRNRLTRYLRSVGAQRLLQMRRHARRQSSLTIANFNAGRNFAV
jgi:hypothetical protein